MKVFWLQEWEWACENPIEAMCLFTIGYCIGIIIV